MTTITKCTTTSCPKRDHCYRAKATSLISYQQYERYQYMITAHGVQCDHYILDRTEQINDKQSA